MEILFYSTRKTIKNEPIKVSVITQKIMLNEVISAMVLLLEYPKGTVTKKNSFV